MRLALIAGIAAVALLGTGAQVVRLARAEQAESSSAAARERRRALASERLIRDQDISFYQSRIARDPTGALDLLRVGALYLQRYRETGDEADLVNAETAARRSLHNRESRNEAALQLLQSALMGQHRFAEARVSAQHLLGLDSGNALSRAILGETLLELGDYHGADSFFRPLMPRRYESPIAPRYARWLELRGHAALARRLLESARDDEARRGDAVRPQQLAWYELRLGELALRFGDTGEARRRLDRGLTLVPDDWRLLAARARLALATGNPRDAIALGDSSLARHLDPATLATVGDAWRVQGDSAAAREYYRAMEASTQAPRGGFHRAWYLALLDHDLRVPEILAAVRRDLETRRDVYGYDLLAWALFKSGHRDQARAAIAQALAWGTEDPLLHRHAAIIEAAR